MASVMERITQEDQVPTKPIKVFIVDDQDMVREALRISLEQEESLEVVGEADGGVSALEQLRHTQVDVVLLDVDMERMNGIETLVRLKQMRSDIKVLMVTSFGGDYIMSAIEAGAAGYILKQANRAALAHAVQEVYQGRPQLDPLAVPRLLEDVASAANRPQCPLSPRETQVLQLVATGCGNKEVSAVLGVSPQTVKNQLTSILTKMDAHSRTHAVTMALRKGWITNPS